MRDWMVSSWTVALLFQQLNRYAEVLRRAGRTAEAEELRRARRRDARATSTAISSATAPSPAMPCSTRTASAPELLLHPSDTRTGLNYSLLPMTQRIIGGLFTPEQAQHICGSSASICCFPTARG